MERINVVAVMMLFVFGFSAAHADVLYKWVDSQGRVSYHDQPPPDGTDYQVQKKVLGPNHSDNQDDTLAKIAEKYPVVLYAVPHCGACDLARAYLQKRKVPFTEKNVDSNVDQQQALKKISGSLSVPTITIGDKVMNGYVESVLKGMLDDVGYPKNLAPAPDDSGNPPPAIKNNSE
ncbi:MAG: glutaredoxin domain-containing protein [Sulfuricaulis sp.]